MSLMDNLWPAPRQFKESGEFDTPKSIALGTGFSDDFSDDLNLLRRVHVVENSSFNITVEEDASISEQGYVLEVKENGMLLKFSTLSGRRNGQETILQVLGYAGECGRMPSVVVDDAPQYKKRCFMADMGRSTYNVPMLKLLIKMLNRLKMNQLHLHLFDDELCGIKFPNYKFGHDNPYALSLDELAEVIEFAGEHQIEVVPELEGWGHVGSLVYHYPKLRGGDGVYSGSSFLICEEVFAMMADMIEQIARIMPDTATIHLGLDEAIWFPGEDMPEGFTPTDMVQRYYDILKGIEKKLGKNLTMRIWADHDGRPLPEAIADQIILEPWNYWGSLGELTDGHFERYSKGKSKWIAGAGQSMGQYRGAFHSTRNWARKGVECSNLEGINLTFWGRNEIADNLLTVFAGSGYIWNPFPDREFADIEDYERFDRLFFPLMFGWQNLFAEFRPENLKEKSGESVYNGFYWFGDKHGQPVSPGVPSAGTTKLHNFLAEAD